MEPIDTFEHAGLTVEIVPEEYVDESYDPRECDQLGHMAVCYRGYELGDEQLPEGGFDSIECPACEGFGQKKYDPDDDSPENECPRCEGTGEVEPTLDEWLDARKAIAVMPLFVLDHSGLRIRTGNFRWRLENCLSRDDTASRGRFIGDGAGWDTSFVGFIYCTRERCDELGVEITPENIERQLEGEVKEYDAYLSGDAGGWVVKNEDEVLDSCWGYLWPNSDDVRSEAKHAAEACRDEIEQEKAERASWAARDVMTVC